jgi:hypothetical protein
MRFMLDGGRRIGANQTPWELGMEDEDVIIALRPHEEEEVGEEEERAGGGGGGGGEGGEQLKASRS